MRRIEIRLKLDSLGFRASALSQFRQLSLPMCNEARILATRCKEAPLQLPEVHKILIADPWDDGRQKEIAIRGASGNL